MSVNMEKIRTAGMSRDAWLVARRHSLGGSDAAAVMGLNPYKSPFALWAEKTGMVPEPDISLSQRPLWQWITLGMPV